MCSNFEEQTIKYLEDDSNFVSAQHIHRYVHTEYFSATDTNQNMFLPVSELEVLPPESLVEGAKHGHSFRNIVLKPDQVTVAVFNEFVKSGGGVYRGTVRDLAELVEGGTSSFCRMSKMHPKGPIKSPSAVVICVGLGARFIGGIEDVTVKPTRIQYMRLRAPWVTSGKTFYDTDNQANFFAAPLGNGDVSTSFSD
ncbi:hypothetical protein MD484_g7709, partial [Candolleomyces efflorescens]